MRSILIAAAACAAALLATPAAAEGWRGELGYTQYDTDSAEVGAITGRLGYDFTPHVGVEGEVGIGVGDDDGAELDSAIGGFVIGRLPVAQNFSVHGRLGYARLDGNGGDDDGVAYGVGGQYDINSRFGVRGDYTRISGDNDDADSFAVTAVIRW
jgi:hypothetical protein